MQREFSKLLAPGAPGVFRVTSVAEGQGKRAVRPESVAAGIFGVIAALAALVLASQSIRRMIASSRDERGILRALGASPFALILDACAGITCAIAAGAALAIAVAVAASPLAPLGQLHRFEPDPGVALDWTVLGGGGRCCCCSPCPA